MINETVENKITFIPPRQILVFRTDRLVELLLTLPAIQTLKQSFSQSQITLVVHPRWGSLVKKVPWIDKVIPYDEKNCVSFIEGWRLAGLLKKENKTGYDISIAFHPKKSFNLASTLLGIPIKIGYARKWGVLLTHAIPDRKYLSQKHEIEYNLELAQQIPGVRLSSPIQLFYPITGRDRENIVKKLEYAGVTKEEPLVAIHPMTSDPNPWFGARHFIPIAHEIARHYGWRTVWVGSQEETRETDPLLAQLGEPHLNWVGVLSLEELGVLLERCKLLISIDSGPVHIAAAVGTPTVVLFGKGNNPGQPRRWGPWGNRHQLLYRTSIREKERGYTLEEIMSAVERCL